MQVRVGILALAIVCAVGCNKDSTNNAPADNNQPSVASTNIPESSNNQPANTAPEANNAPDANKPADPKTATVNPDPSKPNLNDPKKAFEKTKEEMKKAEPKFTDISKAGTDNWTKSQLAAKTLAESVDARMKKLKDNKMSFKLVAKVPEGNGTINVDTLVADSSRYLIRYAVFVPRPDAHFESVIVAQQNGKDTTLVGEKYQPGRVAPSADTLSGWLLNSTQYIVSGIGTSKKPFSDLIAAAQKAKWTINVEKKKYSNADFNRILMESPNEPKRRYEIIVHPEENLPLVFNADLQAKKKSSISLNIAWAHSDTPLTAEQLLPKVKTEPVNVLTADEAKKRGIKVPEKPKTL